jgi:hypothetical protein
MNLKKKIIAWTVFTILAIPALAIFNDDESQFFINALGLAYAYVMIKLAPLFLPAWMIEYYCDCEDDSASLDEDEE